ncbi:MAG: hypothetical protein JF567_00290 [Xanthomonadales bacterium]|nr:hypothetical protein [Xanthomonadales bacterium]
MKTMKSFAVIPLFAALAMAGTASAQSTPGHEANEIGHNARQDGNFVSRNVKQDWRDLTHGRIGAAHQRHKRELSSAHRRHRNAVWSAHQRHKGAVKCFFKTGHSDCRR